MFRDWVKTRIWSAYVLSEVHKGNAYPDWDENVANALLNQRWSGFKGKLRKVKDFNQFLLEMALLGIGGT